MDKQAVVIDNGTGYTKMGYAGNLDPDFVIPTAIADLDKKSTLSVSTKNDEYNYYIGEQAINKAKEFNKGEIKSFPKANTSHANTIFIISCDSLSSPISLIRYFFAYFKIDQLFNVIMICKTFVYV